MKVLVIGPDINKTKGGMSSVVKGMIEDPEMNKKVDISLFSSTIDGNFFIKVLYGIVALFRFKKHINKYDIFHINIASNGSSFRKSLYVRLIKNQNKKVVLHIHGGEYLKFYDSLNGLKKIVIDNMWKKSDAVIVLSDYWKKELQERFSESNIIVIENGINTKKFLNGVSDLNSNADSLLFVGRIVAEKGIYELIDALAILNKSDNSIKLTFAGEGEVEKLKKHISLKKLDDSVSFKGWITEDELIKLLSYTGIVVLPSYSEALPICLLEGMASGKGIVATKVGAIPEVITSKENGILVMPKDSMGLACAVKEMIEIIKDNRFDGNANIRLVENKYSWQCMHKNILKVYYTIGGEESAN